MPAVTDDDTPFDMGKALTLHDGTDVTIVATGTMTSRALDAARTLRLEGLSARVLSVTFVEPLDTSAILAAARETGRIVTAEEATTTGGLGAAVATLLAEHAPTPMHILGVPRRFAPTGSTAFLLDHFGLTADGIAAAARELAQDATR